MSKKILFISQYFYPDEFRGNDIAFDGSITTGKCVMDLRMGTALISSVFRVAVSNVRIPRSQRIT